jgi:hypothetical protein
MAAGQHRYHRVSQQRSGRETITGVSNTSDQKAANEFRHGM